MKTAKGDVAMLLNVFFPFLNVECFGWRGSVRKRSARPTQLEIYCQDPKDVYLARSALEINPFKGFFCAAAACQGLKNRTERSDSVDLFLCRWNGFLF